MAILSLIRRLRAENDDLSQARLTRQIDVSRRTLAAIEGRQRVQSLEVAHRIADAPDCNLDNVFHYESELPAMEEEKNDGGMTVIVRTDDEPEWWKFDDVSRVTTSAKRCSDAARKPHNHAVSACKTRRARRVMRHLCCPAPPILTARML